MVCIIISDLFVAAAFPVCAACVLNVDFCNWFIFFGRITWQKCFEKNGFFCSAVFSLKF